MLITVRAYRVKVSDFDFLFHLPFLFYETLPWLALMKIKKQVSFEVFNLEFTGQYFIDMCSWAILWLEV